MYGSIASRFDESRIPYKRDVSIAQYSTFKSGGRAALAVFPRSREELIEALRILLREGVRAEIVGNASNVLFAFDFFDGALVFTGGASGARVEGEGLYAECGSSLTYISRLAESSSLSGLEFAYGIPGLVGGSIYMNAGAYGSQMSEVLAYSDAYDTRNDRIERIYDHGFGYRKSIYMERPELVCLGGYFSLSAGDSDAIGAKMRENMESRRKNQPLEFPSAGSYFKRPEGHFAGKLIEDCGLKGERVGGAEVSEKHAGFIINRGGATWQDILALEEKIKEKVMSLCGVLLEREVRLIK